MITDFRVSIKTRPPSCCDWSCCGCRFGRIERSHFTNTHGRINRVRLARRYAKHVDKMRARRDMREEMN